MVEPLWTADDASYDLRATLQRFLAGCRQPTLQEQGDEPIAIVAGNFSIEGTPQQASLSVWDESRNWRRRVRAIRQAHPGRLILEVERFGRPPGQAWLFDEFRPEASHWSKRGERNLFRDRFHRHLQFAFPSAAISQLSAERDLQRSFSSRFPRAALREAGSGPKAKRAARRGALPVAGWAAIGLPPDGDADELLAYGLVWLAHLEQTDPDTRWQGLLLVMPNGTLEAANAQKLVACRIRHLTGRSRFRLFLYDSSGAANSPGTRSAAYEADLADLGNLHTHLFPAAHTPALQNSAFLNAGLPGNASALPQAVAPQAPFAVPASGPEAELEAILRQNLAALDLRLLPNPVYGQVSAITGIDRGIADLLAIDRQGRLHVIEIKASEDINLPLQALDYWHRVQQHAAAGELTAAGYFSGLVVSPLPPKLLLVAPALTFHPSTETLLGYFSSAIAVERIGLGMEWRSRLRVLFRLCGADPAVRPEQAVPDKLPALAPTIGE